MEKFNELPLNPTILKNLEDSGYTTPTPIQREAIPHLLEGKDLLGIAQTGTGKTAAFSLPIINYLVKNPKEVKNLAPRVLILSPTRELASQISANIQKYSKGLHIGTTVIFGGVGQAPQVAAIRRGLDIIVATPGRLLDLMEQGLLKIDTIEVFVLDEADRMLDMGFIHDIKKVIAKLPKDRHTLLFSATMPDEISRLASNLLKNPVRVEVTPPSSTVERIDQRVIFTQRVHKYQLLRKLLGEEGVNLTLVFTRTKHGANKIVDYLAHHQIPSAAIHGNKSQSARESALSSFKEGKIKVLIATDIAARGLDINGVSHVINFDLPVEAESYVHRIGRTARAGKEGDAISFCDETERDALSRIQKLIKLRLITEEFVGEAEGKLPVSKPFRDPRRDMQRSREPRQDDRGPRQESRDQRPDNRGPRPDDRGPRPDNRGPRPDNRGPRPDNRGPRQDDRGPRRDDRGPRRDDRGPRQDDRGPRRDDRPRNDNPPPQQQNRPPVDKDNVGNRAPVNHKPQGGNQYDDEDDFQPGYVPSPEEQMQQMEKRIDGSRDKRPRFRGPRPQGQGAGPGRSNENRRPGKTGFKFRKKP
ncbi:MAG: DEAD/DEAH box helicase [Bdellovibrionota bacterium]